MNNLLEYKPIKLLKCNKCLKIYKTNKYKKNCILNNFIELYKKVMDNISKIIKFQRICKEKIKKNNEFLEVIDELIYNNNYIKNCKSNNNKDSESLSSLIIRPLSQSDCIKLGYALERIFYDIIIQFTHLKDIKPKNKKGNKEKDHLFCDEKKKIIYYSELKSNLNLDTEKSKSTYNKCLDIFGELKQKYPYYNIKWCIVGCKYINNKHIPNKVKYKYKTIEKNLFGIND
jgi:hypothetical protein